MFLFNFKTPQSFVVMLSSHFHIIPILLICLTPLDAIKPFSKPKFVHNHPLKFPIYKYKHDRILSAAATPSSNNCICPLYCLPFCAENGQTYCNECLAKCAGTKEAYPGPCLDCHQPCSKEYVPVCSTNNLTYKNICFLICKAHKKYKADGVCPQISGPCKCISNTFPVCWADGNIYANFCQARCHCMSTVPFSYCEDPTSVDQARDNPRILFRFGMLSQERIDPDTLLLINRNHWRTRVSI